MCTQVRVREREALSLVVNTFDQDSAAASDWNSNGSVAGSATSTTAAQQPAAAAVGAATRRAKEKSSMNVHSARKRILAGTISVFLSYQRSHKYSYI
jgi:hypothetical protein